jgi:putative ABC transport system permease protein
MKLLRLIWKNALRNPRRSVLTILSITVSIFLVSTLQAILRQFDSVAEGSGSSHLRLVTRHAVSLGHDLPIAYKARIAALPGVKYVNSFTWFGGIYRDPQNFFANFAVDTDDFAQIMDEFKIPPDQLTAWKEERTAALVGRKLMDQYGWKIGDRVTLQGTIYPADLEFIIRAVYTAPREADETAFYFHWDYFDEALGRRGRAGTFSVKAETAEDVPRLMDAIDGMFRNSDAETKTETEQAFNLSFVSMLGNVKLLLNAISAAVIFTILLVAGNTMAMSIRERTGEVAVLKTLGYRRNTILFLLVGESAAIALLGGAFGSVGAKAAYAFIDATSGTARNLGSVIFAAGAALILGYGTWMLFAGTSHGRGVSALIRYATTLLGGLSGFGTGYGFYMATAFVMNQGGFLAGFSVRNGTLFLGLGISAMVGILSAAFPALRASRTGIADALRYVG